MNKTIAIYVEDTFLIAGACSLIVKKGVPKDDDIQVINHRGEPFYPFCFHKEENRAYFSKKYRANCLDGKENYAGNSLMELARENKLDLLYDLIEQVKEQHTRLTGNTQFPIKAKVAFAKNIDEETRQKFKTYLEKREFEITKESDLAKNWIATQKPEIGDKQLLTTALGNDINLYLVETKDGITTTLDSVSFPYYGVLPKLFTIATEIVDSINNKESLLISKIQKEKEYKRHFDKARMVLASIKDALPNTPQLKNIQIETAFVSDLERELTTTIDFATVEQKATARVKEYKRLVLEFLEKNNTTTSDLGYIWFLGEVFLEKEIQNCFSEFRGHKEFLSPDNVLALLGAVMFETEEKPKSAGEYREVNFVRVPELKLGQKVKLLNNDPRPGKGEAVQEFEYLGYSEFKVLESSRSLAKNDIAVAIMPEWRPGNSIALKVTRGPKVLGKFQTRPVVRIFVK